MSMNRVFEYCKGSIKNRPKLTAVILVATTFGAIGTGLSGFTDMLDWVWTRGEPTPVQDRAWVTHTQFNTMIIPLVQTTTELKKQVRELQHQNQILIDMVSQLESSDADEAITVIEKGRGPATVEESLPPVEQARIPSPHPSPQDTNLYLILDRVQESQRKQQQQMR